MSIYEQVPFPGAVMQPSALALLLQNRIKYMFGITVEPVIVRHAGSFYKTRDFRYCWSMLTVCGRFEIACYEPASVMAEKPAWHVLDQYDLLKYKSECGIIGKVIY